MQNRIIVATLSPTTDRIHNRMLVEIPAAADDPTTSQTIDSTLSQIAVEQTHPRIIDQMQTQDITATHRYYGFFHLEHIFAQNCK